MPTFAINPAQTFTAAILMGTAPKTEFGTDTQSRTDNSAEIRGAFQFRIRQEMTWSRSNEDANPIR